MQKHADLFGFVDDFLCVLRTYYEAMTAKDTFVADDVRLVAREANRLYRAISDALVAVFTV